MNILAVDTSSKAASVALYKNDALAADCFYNHGKTHSVYIAPMIKEMLEACDTSMSDIDYFACGIGPGSFTGVRIGVTMVKTFAMVEEKQCIGVDSLYAAALFHSLENVLTVAIEDARRNRVFACGVLNGKIVLDTQVFTLNELYNAVLEHNNKVLFVGGGARVYGDDIKNNGFSANGDKLITGSAIIKAALIEIKKGNTLDCYSLMPKYLLKSQAEQNRE
ncbi:MAG: tRNA (adenosine(37)-N6)-threonylcarbamoyltransferase complex dimerization subunit type 1 TsaB [Clostridia bacterium]|nr:tRNA (adenosine(37)-N6)-threonylcarbamoyltransferase complex dimerization subunit type 1 TsaB [Clostridia bacterium]